MHRGTKISLFVLGSLSLLLSNCSPEKENLPTNTPKISINPTLSPIITKTTTITAIPKPHFYIGEEQFRFVGAFVSGQIWSDEYWDELVIEDYIASAKASGISVFHVMSPQFENELGNFREDLLRRMDFFFATAAKYGIYVTFPFLHGFIIANPESDDPYYHPRGVEGLIKDERLNQSFKRHIEVLLTRTNTISGIEYRNDPTILGWEVIEDPVQNPINLPSGELPRITIAEFHDWLNGIVEYIKTIDNKHLVGIMTVSSMELLTGAHEWTKMVDTPNLDFIEAEDTDFDDLNSLNKPFFIMITNRYIGPDENVCEDFPKIIESIGYLFTESLEKGAEGVILRVWESDLAKIPPFDKCYNFTDSMEPITTLLLETANELNDPGYPFPPLSFISIRR